MFVFSTLQLRESLSMFAHETATSSIAGGKIKFALAALFSNCWQMNEHHLLAPTKQ